MPKKLSQPLKYPGGKSYMANKIIGLMPRHVNYVEPYAGGLAVLLSKNPHDPCHQWSSKSHERGTSEVVNDIDGALMNFWQVLRSPETLPLFQRIVEATPFSELLWRESKLRQTPKQALDIQAAAEFFIFCRQSRAGGCKDFATLSVLFQRVWHKTVVQLSNSLLTGKWQRGLPKL